MSRKVLILNGPNLNLLGTREVEIYGRDSLSDIEKSCRSHAKGLGIEVDFRQTNSESELVTWIQDARGTAAAIIINAGAYSHTSIAILDALKALDVPVVEVHLSNIFQRESFRAESYVSRAAKGLIAGFGAQGYRLALDAISQLIGTGAKT
ncbi:MAG: type II 3-dehydroquinate dehydratase [Alphaproteobacteria bacterium]|jgi:3-dehydroquinate dehydratase-2|nr:type II 3-dehydroquinate dehydratase [Alphaproteobacteria bacterium]